MKTTKPQYRGQSEDGRTNRWSIDCPKCGHNFEPPTTRLNIQHLDCPKRKCGGEMFVNYNNEVVTLLEDLPLKEGKR